MSGKECMAAGGWNRKLRELNHTKEETELEVGCG